MARSFPRLGAALAAVIWCSFAWAQATPPVVDVPRGTGAVDRGDPRVDAELVFDVSEVAAGESFRAGVLFRLDPNWHIYWRNPGDAGLASDVQFKAGETSFSPLRFPFPETFRTSDGFITTYGYSKQVLLFSDAKATAAGEGGLRVEAEVDVLACEIACIPARLKLSRTLPVGAQTTPHDEHRASFEKAASTVPQSPEGTPPFRAVAPAPLEVGQSANFELVLAEGWTPGAPFDYFVPDASDALREPKLDFDADRVMVHAEIAAANPRVKGVAFLHDPQGNARWLEIDVPFEQGAITAAAPAGAGSSGAVASPGSAASAGPSLAWVLLLAFLGGALMTLMPCVFPVLALKAYGFARTVNEDRRAVVAHAGAYTAGVVGSMLVLAAVIVALKAGGSSVGWGFQFQQPLFIAAIGAVVVAFALNLFGVFNVGIGANAMVAKVDASQGLSRSVGEGVLAVLLATPCSAPLLGTAVGFAFAAGTGTIFAVLGALGLGLAAPFCLLVLIPGLGKLLPKPGAWMERFKQLLGFALLATAAWLLWVMGGLTGVDGMGRLAGFFVAVGVASWLFGLAQASGSTKRWAGFGVAVAVLAIAGFTLLQFQQAGAARETVAGTKAWSDEAVQAALADGRPVFVDFTADWCLTCKFNERTVLASDRVQTAFEQHGVEVLIADWTRGDEKIRARLAEHGRAGVPMYLVFGPEQQDGPLVLPELLTEEMVVEAIEQVASAAEASASPKERYTP